MAGSMSLGVGRGSLRRGRRQWRDEPGIWLLTRRSDVAPCALQAIVAAKCVRCWWGSLALVGAVWPVRGPWRFQPLLRHRTPLLQPPAVLGLSALNSCFNSLRNAPGLEPRGIARPDFAILHGHECVVQSTRCNQHPGAALLTCIRLWKRQTWQAQALTTTTTTTKILCCKELLWACCSFKSLLSLTCHSLPFWPPSTW